MKERVTPKTPPPPHSTTTTTTTTTITKKMTRHHSSPFPACFRPPSSHAPPSTPHAPPSTTITATSNPNLTTSLYHSHIGIFSLTWSRSLLSRSLHLHLHHHNHPSLSSPVFHLTLKPFMFWTKHGYKKLTFQEPEPEPEPKSIWVFWDLTNARFGSGPDPESGFYIAVLHQGEMTLLVGDMEDAAFARTKARIPVKWVHNNNNNNKKSSSSSSLVLRREHVVGRNKFYSTRIDDLGGRSRMISIELNESSEEDPRLVIRFDQKRVLQVKHLKWKFRGSERVEVEGHPVQLSWDVYNWLFDGEDTGCNNSQDDGYALFTFRFERQEPWDQGHDVIMWSQDSCGLNYERKKMKKRLMMMKKSRTPSLSSSSLSSVSSGCSSVLEWESVEENELKGPTGFSLLVYAWKS